MIRKAVLAFTAAIAASAVLSVPVGAAGSPTPPGQATKLPSYTQSQCTYGSSPSQCAGQINVQDPALTDDRVHVASPWWQWLTWLVLGGLFVWWGWRRPLLRAFRAARAQTEESVAPEIAESWGGRPKNDRPAERCRSDGCGLETLDASVSSHREIVRRQPKPCAGGLSWAIGEW